MRTQGGRPHPALRSPRPAKGFIPALQMQMEPTYVRQRTAYFCRRMLTAAVQQCLGRTFARSWLHRRNRLLGGETPIRRARDFQGFADALQALLIERPSRKDRAPSIKKKVTKAKGPS